MTDNEPGRGPLTRIEQAAGVAGLVFAVLMTTTLVMFGTLATPDPATSLLDWYEQVFSPRLRIVGLYLVPFSGIALLWFMAAIRERAGTRTDRFFDTVFLGSGLLFVAMLFGGAAASVSIIASSRLGDSFTPTEETIRIARLLGWAFFNVYAARAAGVFTMVMSGMLLRSDVVPRWVGFAGIATALVLLLGASTFQLFIYLFPAWIALASLTFMFAFRERPVTSD